MLRLSQRAARRAALCRHSAGPTHRSPPSLRRSDSPWHADRRLSSKMDPLAVASDLVLEDLLFSDTDDTIVRPWGGSPKGRRPNKTQNFAGAYHRLHRMCQTPPPPTKRTLSDDTVCHEMCSTPFIVSIESLGIPSTTIIRSVQVAGALTDDEPGSEYELL
mmetsp:Transcript_39571/g.81313  ORF Transcript_39571/g.81313 Transcript_39571/m.81313 type:complete len:161 (+) Transcript_39571:2855-3337(+)